MTATFEEFSSQLNALREKYAAEIAERFRSLINNYYAYQENPSQEGGAALYRQVHSIAGSAATFGFPEISEIAREFEITIEPWTKSGEAANPGTHASLSRFLDLLREKVEQRSDVDTHLACPAPATSDRGASDGLSRHKPRVENLLYLLGDETICHSDMEGDLRRFGYDTRRFEDSLALQRAMDEKLPTAIIISFSMLLTESGELASLPRVAEMSREGASIPMIFICGRDDIKSRLTAVRSGASAYFTDPLEINDLVESLDMYTAPVDAEPFRVLVIDDDQDQAAYHATVLESHGMKARTVTNPFDLLEPLRDFSPDLILMDLYMPDCGGEELGRVVRLNPAYVSVPIVFFSVERDVARQLEAVSAAGDDFLTKGMDPDHLADSIKTRARRYRNLRSLMMRDGLTGLLNHTNTKVHLEREVQRAARQGDTFLFAMLDLDKFKKVNDTYGHPAGDKVIKSLAKLLRQRLRKSDVIGRYGGEEFALVLTNVKNKDNAAKLLNDLRESFAAIKHKHQDKEFRVTFSCGAAIYPEYDSADALTDAADKAMYQAKRNGRNQIVLANAASIAGPDNENP